MLVLRHEDETFSLPWLLILKFVDTADVEKLVFLMYNKYFENVLFVSNSEVHL